MPTSYQPPTRQDSQPAKTKSQTVTTHSSHPLVSDILSDKSDTVFGVRPDATLGEAVVELRDRRIGALVVTDDAGALIGILSERDIVRKLADTPGQTLPQRVEDVMTRSVVTCTSDDALLSVLKQMSAGRFRHMPVVDDGKVVGMVTIGDVINHRLTQLEQEALHLKQLIVG